MNLINEKRMNYLFQLGNLTNYLNQNSLSRYYLYLNQRISKRVVKRLDKNLKNRVCKDCHSLFLKKRFKKNKMILKCHLCNKIRIFKIYFPFSFK